MEEQSESKGISPTFSKSMAKRIWVLQKYVKMKQNEVKLFKILHVQDRSKTNIFVSNCVEEEKRDRVILRMRTWKCVRQNNSLIGPNMVRAL